MEMMDSSEAHYPGLAVQHARKYRKLLGFTEDALEELAQVVG
jgi:hypothetical protein